MNALRYSFSQIEAFAAIAEFGTVSRAAEKLRKDRTTVRDLRLPGGCPWLLVV